MTDDFKPEEAIKFLGDRLSKSGCSQCGEKELSNLNFFHPKWHPVKEFYEMLQDDKFLTLSSVESYLDSKNFDVMCSTCLQKLIN
jgi:hypothetical protein